LFAGKIGPGGHRRGRWKIRKSIRDVKRTGLSGEAAIMAAFELNKSDVARVSGN